MRFVTFLLVVAWLLVQPSGIAGTAIETPVAKVILVDQRETCRYQVCAHDVEGEPTSGNATIDASQEIQYVGIAADADVAGGLLPPLALLPDFSLFIRGEDLAIRHPAFRLLTFSSNATAESVPTDLPVGSAMSSKQAAIYYDGPAMSNLTGKWDRHDVGMEYAQGPGIGYETVGPFNAPRGGDLDGMWPGYESALCDWGVADETCRSHFSAASAEVMNKTPNIVAGVQWYEFQLASSPGLLANHSSNQSRQGTHASIRNRLTFPMESAETGSTEGAGPIPKGETTLEHGNQEGGQVPKPPGSYPPSDGEGKPPGGSQDAKFEVAARLVGSAVVVSVLVTLYNRVQRARLLESPVRLQLLELIRKNPGFNLTELAVATGLTRNAALHHLLLLEKHGHVQSEKHGRALCFIPSSSIASQDLVHLAALKHPIRKRLHELLQEVPRTQAELAAQVGVSVRLVSHHLAVLQSAGHVTRTGERPGRYSLTKSPL